MKVIDYNPKDRVPPIKESYLKTKIIISDLQGTACHFVSYAKKDETGICFYGAVTGDHWQFVRKWSGSYNKGYKNLIDVMIAEMNWLPEGWHLKFFVLESEQEVINFIKEYGIRDQLKENILARWQQIKDQNF